MAQAHADGLTAAGRRASVGRSWLLPTLGAATTAALMVLLAVWLFAAPEAEVLTRQVKTPSTFRIAGRVVAMVDPGAVLGAARDADGIIRVQQDAGSVVYRSDGARLIVTTPAGTVSVVGTCFRVRLAGADEAAGAGTALLARVFEGQVDMESGGHRLALAAAETGAVERPGGPPLNWGEAPADPCPISDTLFANTEARLSDPEARVGAETSVAADAAPSPGKAAEDLVTDPVGDLVLEGQVVDAAGLPVAGARVAIGTRPRRTTTSAANGTFSFARLTPRVYSLTARRGADVCGTLLHELTGTSDPVVIRLFRANDLIVRVTDASAGTPIQGAEVKIKGVGERLRSTDGNGAVLFEGVAPIGCLVQVTKPGYAQAGRYVRIPTATGYPVTADFALRTGAALSGAVLDASGAPVAGARVTIEDAVASSMSYAYGTDGAITDSQGHFAFAAVPAGKLRLKAAHPEFVSGYSGTIETNGAKPVREVLIRLDPTALVRGVVLDDSGHPVPWASVRVAPPADSPKRMAGSAGGATFKLDQAGAGGTFEIGGLPREPMAFGACDERDIADEVVVDLTGRARVDGVELRLHPAGRIAGKVVDGSGKSMAEVYVLAIGNPLDGTYVRSFTTKHSLETVTNGAGDFAFAGLVEGTYVLRASLGPGRIDPARQDRQTVEVGTEDVLIRLEPDGALRGRAVFTDGGHPTRFAVVLSESMRIPVESADGTFELGAIRPGEVDLAIDGEGFATKQLDGVAVEANQTTDLGDIRLQRGRRLTGRVLDSRGRPVAGAEVFYGDSLVGDGQRLSAAPAYGSGMDMNKQVVVTGEDGSFAIAGVSDHKAVVAAEHAQLGRSAAREVPAGAGPVHVELVVAEFASLEGAVLINGEAAGGTMVFVYDKDATRQQLSVMTKPDGSYAISRLAPGPTRVMVIPPSERRSSAQYRDLDIRPGEHAKLDIDVITGDVSLRVKVTPAPGARVDRAWSYLSPGTLRATTGAELRAAARRAGVQAVSSAWCQPPEPCKHDGLVAGDYTVCLFPLTGDVDDSEFISSAHDRMDEMNVICAPVHVASSPPTQEILVTVPQMKPF